MKNPASHRCPARQDRRTGLRPRILATTIAAALAGQFLLAGSARAQTIWADGTGSWFVPGNWSTNALPTAGDDVQINNGGTAQIFSAGAVSNNGYLGFNMGDVGSVLVSGSGSTWTNSSDLTVGESGTGTLTIQSGGTVSNTDSLIGNSTGSTSTVTVSGPGSILTNSSVLDVGNNGPGQLTIQNGGTVSNASGYIGLGGNGTVLVTGPGSTLTNSSYLYVGFVGTGQLTIQNGGTVTNATGNLGFISGSTGTVTVTGAGSTWTNSSDLTVGESGTGTLTIQSGGTVSNATGYIGNSPGSTGTVLVSGPGSTWTNSSDLYVGNNGTGQLTIQNGGTVSNANGYIGNNSGSNGNVLVSGPGSTWTNSSDLYVGNNGTGQLTIQNGGTVSNVNGNLGYSSGSTGTVTVTGAGSTWTNSSDLTVGESGTGTLTIQSGGTVSNTQGDIGNSSGGNGTVTVTGAGSTWTNSSDLYVGGVGGTGQLTIQNGGTVSNSHGTLGFISGGAGTVLVSGPGSTWTNSSVLAVGDSGTGQLTIQNGGTVSTSGGIIAVEPGSTGTVLVSGPGSTWTNSDGLAVGLRGTGQLTIQNGGTVSASNNTGFIGYESGSTGTVLVTGAGSTWTNNSVLIVGESGTGQLTIQNGGAVSVGGTGIFTLADNGGGTGTLNIGAFGGGTTAGTLLANSVTGGSGTAIVNFNQTDTTTFSPEIDGNIAVNQLGTGNTILTAANTYSGATTINAGTLTLGFGAVSTNILPTASALVLGGGTLSLTGTGTQTVNASSTTASTSSVIQLGSHETLTLSALTIGANSALNFNTATGGANGATVGTGVVVLTGPSAGAPINPNFTVTDAGGFGLATVNGSQQVVRLISTLLPPSLAMGTTDYLINNNANGPMAAGSSTLTVTVSESAKSVTVDTTAASGVLTLNSTVVLSTDTWNFGGNGANPYLITGSANGAGLQSATSGGTLTINNFNTGAVTIASPILDNNTSSVVFNGPGTTILTGANTYAGATTVTAGTLQVSGGGTINAHGDITVDGGNRPTLLVDGSTPSSVATSGNIFVGNNSAGQMTIQNGGTVSNGDGYIGNSSGSNGTVLVSGPGSTWTNSGVLNVGESGTGTLTIQSGGTVSSNGFSYISANSGSTGTVLVSGPGSTWTNSGFLNVGESGTGTLTIQNGGTVSSNGFSYISANSGSTGTVLVSGPGSTWTNIGDFYVGFGGTGTLTIQNGGMVSNATGFIGVNSGSNGTVLVSGPGSTWTNSGDLNVGNGGTGLLTIQNGGTVSNANGYIGNGGNGTALVSGPGSTWTNNNNVLVGFNGGTGQLTIQNGGTVSVGGGGTGTVALAGNGSGTGTLNIGAFGGGTTAGTLQAGTVTDGGGTAILNFNQTDTTTFAPQITGNVAVNQLGSGTTILPGANTYSGGTTINAGTLRTQNAGALGGGAVALKGGDLNPIGLLNVTALNWGAGRVALVNPSTDGGATGDILTATTLTKNAGGGTYALGQVSQNTLYTLTTFTTNSGFSVTDFSAQGITPSVLFQGMFTLNAGNVQFTITGATATLGNGALLQNSAPVDIPTFADVTITGAVTTGAPTDNNTVHTLAFTPGGSLLIYNLLTVTQGPVILVGGSSITLDGSLSASQLELLAGSLLKGNGTIVGDLLNLGGTVSPGNSPGLIHVTGNYVQGPGGTLQIEIAGRHTGQFDVLAVDGKASLNGTLNIVRLNNFQVRRGDTFKFLTAGQGVSGEFAHVADGLATDTILNPVVVYHQNDVSLEVPTFESFADSSNLTPNQKSVARALDSTNYDRRANNLISYLESRNISELPGDFDRIAPEELTSVFTLGVSLANVQSQNIQRRTDDIRSGSTGFNAANLALNGNGPSFSGAVAFRTGVAGPNGDIGLRDEGKEVKETKEVVPAENRWGVFLSGTGEWVSVGDTDNARGYDLESGGFTLGVDYKVTPNLAIGLAAGYTGTTADLTDRGRIYVNGGKIGLYGTFFQNEQPAPTMSKNSSKEAPTPAPTIAKGFYADVAVFGGYNSYDTRRSALQGEARGDTDGGELNVLFGTGYDFKKGGLTFGPTASFNYTYIGTNEFTEHGSLAPLNVHGGKGESLRTAFGFKASYDWKVGGIIIKPELRAAWQHEYGDSAYALDANFANGAGNSFLVNGPELGRDSALLGAGVAFQCSERCSTYFYYDGELGRKNYQATNVTGGFRLAF